jgi:NTE family protein
MCKHSETVSSGNTDLSGTALCLSGGGYRAMLFHLGSIWRLYETGLLAEIDLISSVSGGSITAAVLGMHWDRISVENPHMPLFKDLVVDPLRKLAGATIDIGSVLMGFFGFGTGAKSLPKKYSKILFRKKTLQDLPDHPCFVINSTNVQSGALWRFSKSCIRDWRVGKIADPATPLAVAVAASSACPPFLSPLIMDFKESQFVAGTGYDLQKPPFTTRVVLTDGGVYDNLGLETAWKRHKRILVSNAGGQMPSQAKPSGRLLPHAIRVNSLIDNQVRSLRKRQLINSYLSGDRDGAYWSIRSDIADYGLPDALECPHKTTMKLALEPTRLKKLKPSKQEKLINWGYAACDVAIRRYVGIEAAGPENFPYASTGI